MNMVKRERECGGALVGTRGEVRRGRRKFGYTNYLLPLVFGERLLYMDTVGRRDRRTLWNCWHGHSGNDNAGQGGASLFVVFIAQKPTYIVK
jgi:hypothetical protein